MAPVAPRPKKGRTEPHTDCCSLGRIGKEQASQGAVTEDTGGSALSALSPGCAGARALRGGCALPPAEWLRAPAVRGLGLLRPPVPCPRCGSAPCRTWLQSPGEVQETLPKLHYVLLARFLLRPVPHPGPRSRSRRRLLRVGPACLLLSRAHAQPRSLGFTQTLSPPRPNRGVRNYWTNCRRDCRSRPVAWCDPLPARVWAPACASAAADEGELGALPALRRGGAREQR